jgi:hypothetical protein
MSPLYDEVISDASIAMMKRVHCNLLPPTDQSGQHSGRGARAREVAACFPPRLSLGVGDRRWRQSCCHESDRHTRMRGDRRPGRSSYGARVSQCSYMQRRPQFGQRKSVNLGEPRSARPVFAALVSRRRYGRQTTRHCRGNHLTGLASLIWRPS